ncbi:unnamed protein product [Pedinophyceae sp. YPF-701]|nr:unnamed protein product [Pedinophyceae sp. YPF-701]
MTTRWRRAGPVDAPHAAQRAPWAATYPARPALTAHARNSLPRRPVEPRELSRVPPASREMAQRVSLPPGIRSPCNCRPAPRGATRCRAGPRGGREPSGAPRARRMHTGRNASSDRPHPSPPPHAATVEPCFDVEERRKALREAMHEQHMGREEDGSAFLSEQDSKPAPAGARPAGPRVRRSQVTPPARTAPVRRTASGRGQPTVGPRAIHALDDMFGMAGSRVLVVGGARGTGAAVARQLAEIGARVVVTGASRDAVDAVRGDFEKHALRLEDAVCADTATPEGREAVARALDEAFLGALDVVVLTPAHHQRRRQLHDVDLELQRRVYASGQESQVELLKMLHPALVEGASFGPRGEASVVFLTAVGAELAEQPAGPAFSMSAASSHALVRWLACSWGPQGIRVNAVAPHLSRSPASKFMDTHSQFMSHVRARTPLQRPAELREVASVAAFLAGPASSYMTGQVLPVCGGHTVQGTWQHPGVVPEGPAEEWWGNWWHFD